MDKKIVPKQFIFVLVDGFIHDVYSDLYKDNRVTVIDRTIKMPKNKFLKLIRKIHVSWRINKDINLPFKSVWGKPLNDLIFEKNKQYYLIFVDPYPLNGSYIAGLKKKYNVKVILNATFVWDSQNEFAKMHHKYHDIINYDYIFSFDPADCKKFHFTYYSVPYSIIHQLPNSYVECENDLYYVANGNKGRLNLMFDVYEKIHNKLSTHYRIVGVPKDKQLFSDEIIFNKKIPYQEVINGVIKSNCILEILEENQSGATLRYYEAVCYNKKLLTNNKNVVNLPFYNPDYIHIFEKPEDIDWEWVKKREPIDYHYDGRFSPTHLIDKIIELEEEREKEENGKKQDN